MFHDRWEVYGLSRFWLSTEMGTNPAKQDISFFCNPGRSTDEIETIVLGDTSGTTVDAETGEVALVSRDGESGETMLVHAVRDLTREIRAYAESSDADPASRQPCAGGSGCSCRPASGLCVQAGGAPFVRDGLGGDHSSDPSLQIGEMMETDSGGSSDGGDFLTRHEADLSAGADVPVHWIEDWPEAAATDPYRRSVSFDADSGESC
ncbi:hypothetical protein FJT64_004626 [Amphibalanus amphitrite]|uniref:Uncharacterized protein n=1 Tax=Amphibalanus amphitrite TaxID=1232801 RepID=A0A6A4VPB1_AMPAM|nr:hypothetical protein FJT64_004626 [Amphibalanus amphitrite]